MRLTQPLQFYRRYRRVQGLMRFGKNRVIPPISIDLKRKVAEVMVIERSNVDILNKPYLSVAEEDAYHQVVERVPYKNDEQLKKEEIIEKLEKLPPNYRTEDLLVNLNKSKKWE